MQKPLFLALVIAVAAHGQKIGREESAHSSKASQYASAPTSYADQTACRVKSVEKLATVYEGVAKSPTSDVSVLSEPDAKGVYQIYMLRGGRKTCISCAQRPGGPRVDRNKMMVTWHPSGQWLAVGIEEDKHDLMWMPKSAQLGLLQSGIWLNMWITTPDGSRWFQITDFKNDGFVGTPFTPDGRKAVWVEAVDGNVFANRFGKWKLYRADFEVRPDGTPSFIHKTEITPAGARWVEPGNFSPDGRHLLLSTDIGLKDAFGQDQWALDIETGALQQLTSTPTVWDEHGVYSADGRKISFMSSYPYRNEKDSYKVSNLKTEFMLMDADGSHLQQLTHFNEPGYPESQPSKTIAAVAGFFPGDGSRMFGIVMGPNFSKTNWEIGFEGLCGD